MSLSSEYKPAYSTSQESLWDKVDDLPDIDMVTLDTLLDAEASENHQLQTIQITDLGDISDAAMLVDTEGLAESPLSASGSTSLGKRQLHQLSSSDASGRATSSSNTESSFISAAQASFTSADAPVIIAFSAALQPCITKRGLRFGVQFEIARLISMRRASYDQITFEHLDQLKGPNAIAAPKVPFVLAQVRVPEQDTAFAKEIAARSPWKELDIEETALATDSFSGLGFSKSYPEGNYGGKVIFGGKLKENISSSAIHPYFIQLEAPEIGTSCLFARRFGSWSILHVKIPNAIRYKSGHKLIEFFKKPFVLGEHVYRAFFSKEDNVFLICTNEIYDGIRISIADIKGKMSLWEFLNWWNPLSCNKNQSMAKWASRAALGLSNSVPGIQLEPSNVIEISDIISCDGSEMTDGAGIINNIGIKELFYKFSWSDIPSAIQCRLRGSKGLLVLTSSSNVDVPYVGLRPSQIKIHYNASTYDPSRYIIDVLRASHARTPSKLSVEVIINLAENGVSSQIFVTLLKQGLEALVKPLITWEGSNAMKELWLAIARNGGVMAARLAREKVGEARALGYTEKEAEDLDDEEGFQEMKLAIQKSSAWWVDQTSGCPSSLEETVMYLLEAGFKPQTLPVLREKLKSVVMTCINRYVHAYRIDIPMSVTAMLVPDEAGVLEPGEIFFKSSRCNLPTSDGLETDIVLGDVLLTRNPCKLPSDVQKWRAVNKPELHYLVNVIVLSTKGIRRAADYLAGGDYDGDKGLLIFQPELVQPFINAPLEQSAEPSDLAACFSERNEKVAQFLTRVQNNAMEDKAEAAQEYLLGSLRDPSVVGKYSNYHEYAFYTLGYSHPETIRLAYLFCKVLDGSKTGLTIKPEVLKKDTQKYQRRAPVWREKANETSGPDKKMSMASNELNPTRPLHLPPFIMDIICQQAKVEGDHIKQQLEELFSSLSGDHIVDSDLTAPWEKANSLATKWKILEGSARRMLDLEKIQKHVEDIYERHRNQLRAPHDPLSKHKSSFTSLSIVERQDIIRRLSREFASFPMPEDLLMDDLEVAYVKASYAYVYDAIQSRDRKGWTRFPWDVAMRDLCHIKARALGSHKTVTEEFHDRFYLRLPQHN